MASLLDEVWKPIQDYEDIYEISNLGRVRRRKPERYLTFDLSAGYVRVGLCRDGKQIKYLLHRLLALAFIPNPDNLPQIDHIDRNKQNNSLENLRWCSRSFNQENRGIPKNNKTGHKNIQFIEETTEKSGYIRKAHYKVHGYKDGKQIQKRCKTLEDAIELRNEIFGVI